MPITRAVAELMHDITIKENKSFKEHPHFYTTLQDMTTDEQNNLTTQYFDNYHKIQFFYDLEDHIIGSKYKLRCFFFFIVYVISLFKRNSQLLHHNHSND